MWQFMRRLGNERDIDTNDQKIMGKSGDNLSHEQQFSTSKKKP